LAGSRIELASALLLALATAASAASQAADWVPLSRFPLISSEQGWGTLGIGCSVQGHPLELGGKAVDGYGTHAPGRMAFDLDGRCKWFKVRVDLDKEVAYTKKGSVDFSIVGDGRVLFDSGVVRATDQNFPIPVNVDVRGVKVLELLSGDGGDGFDSDHADWLQPEVIVVRAPEMVGDKQYRVVQGKGLSIRISHSGNAVGIKLDGDSAYRRFDAGVQLLGESTVGTSRIVRTAGGGLEIHRESVVGLRPCWVTETFEPSGSGIRWTVQIRSNGDPWSTPVSTIVRFPNPDKWKIWMPWNDPFDSHHELGIGDSNSPWHDPLTPQPFQNRQLSYGENPVTNWWTGDLASLPMVSLMDVGADRGFSFIQSPDDPLPAAQISTGKSGWFAFNRLNRRLGEGRTAQFTSYLVAHAADPKAALGCFAALYPTNFSPPNPAVKAFGGCGAYSGDERILDADAVERLRSMAFKTMWKLSDDYAYMGMFIPPVSTLDERWQRLDDSGSPPNYKPAWTSVRRLNDYARMLKTDGFHLLSYFNAIEFGHDLKAVRPPKGKPAADLWKDPSLYLSATAPKAVLRPYKGQPEGAWQGGWAMDPGDPGYMGHLLTQIDRHLEWLPDSEGICIDRVDYMSQYNDFADDGVTMRYGGRSRALVNSWIKLMDQLGPKMHAKKKVIFANLMDPRLDLARHLDGVYAEFGNQPTVINGLSFLCLDKPLLAWTRDEDVLSDAFFQRHLYLGAFPTAPYPTNNHCIQPSPAHDKWFLDYGPLFAAISGREWVLSPHAVSLLGPGKANVFSVPGGYAATVTFAGDAASAHLVLRALPGLTDRAHFEVLEPGSATAAQVSAAVHNSSAKLTVPLAKGCCVVKILIATAVQPKH
jgi:hypothetical protein